MWIEALKTKAANISQNLSNIANPDPLATTSEDLSNSLDSSINETTNELKMEDQLRVLMEQFNELKLQVQQQQQQPVVTEHKDITVTVPNSTDISLEIFKSLPEFNGERDKYATWRSTTSTAIKLLDEHKTSLRYAEALMIIRNKVRGAASNILNNYNTAFNFDAIIDRLDFTYADKRPLYILEQELSILQQHKYTVDQFYDKINEKLNCIVNKINMSYKEPAIAKAFIENANTKALRTFITGLSNRKGELLYASNPQTLPEAYARLQTITTDQERISFANRYTSKEKTKEGNQMRNPQFRYNDQSRHELHPQFRYNDHNRYELQQNQPSQPNKVEPMDIDKSSMNVNIGQNYTRNNQFNPVFKRSHQSNRQNKDFQSSSYQKQKFQRVNNIQDNGNYAKTILGDERIEETSDDEYDETSSNCSHQSKSASIFLGE